MSLYSWSDITIGATLKIPTSTVAGSPAFATEKQPKERETKAKLQINEFEENELKQKLERSDMNQSFEYNERTGAFYVKLSNISLEVVYFICKNNTIITLFNGLIIPFFQQCKTSAQQIKI
ncbi:hypothetical protein GCM10022277_04290 [Litoribacillus peritrichatus]|uniref:Uncharacterized protein n=1 Tax=Litoribacillus peritrichatus TaxID=718191 RepID=A0ABP7M243_9GAMM